jgi:DNA adenine methylase
MLRWAGSKKRSLVHLMECSPKYFNTYIEPFAGSACLFFNLTPLRVVLGDINPHLIDFYRVASRHPGRVFDTFLHLKRDSETYYRIRDVYPHEIGLIRRAAYFLYLNRNCFNGIFRVNKSGIFNVPFSSSRVPAYPTKDAFIDSMRALRVVTLECTDFVALCTNHVRRDDFVNLDPPYYVPKQRVFCEYVPHEFARNDVNRLVELLTFIDTRGAKFLMNYPSCYMMRKLARYWNYRFIQTRRTISSRLDSRGNFTEILIYNY